MIILSDDEKNLIEEFLQYQKERGRRGQALTGLRKRVPKLLQYLHEQNLLLNEISQKEALGYKGSLVQGRTKDGTVYSPRTIASYLGAATTFFDFLKEKHSVASNPFRAIRKVRVDLKIPRNIFREEQMARFLDALSEFTSARTMKLRMRDYKVHVIAELMYSTGMRIHEVAALKIEDIDLGRGIVHIREGKGGFERIAFLSQFALDVLSEYIGGMRELLRNEWNERNGDLLFGTGYEQLGKVVNQRLRDVSLSLGFPVMKSHGFRHAVGYHLLHAGCPLRYIQQILGHRKLRNTEIYTKVEKESLREVLDTCHPRSLTRRGS